MAASQATIERILAMTEAGKKRGVIARVLGITGHTVDYHRLDAGLLCKPGCMGPGKAYRRGATWIRPYTAEEDERLTKLRIGGYTLARIGAEIGRHPSSVFMRLRTLARRQEAAADTIDNPPHQFPDACTREAAICGAVHEEVNGR